MDVLLKLWMVNRVVVKGMKGGEGMIGFFLKEILGCSCFSLLDLCVQ